MIDLKAIEENTKNAVEELLEVAKLEKGQIFVVGCSTSEVAGSHIGSSGSLEIGEAIFNGLYPPLKERGIHLAVQCCEHLNRALVVDKEMVEKFNLEQVTVFPHQKAGGSFATYVFHKLENSVMVEHIKAHAGIDIGDALIGMHLKHVAVPVRLKVKTIGEGHVTAARVRPKLIGGERAKYCL
ncbi:TIGR01440 family protein [Desulfonispora thiosulfatigenes DSM 11270]|uniref:UPF0340 protein SAMN00017405_1847 n=1 Tax=Desulfonispora thiosulfatigenes DSM 11270 TaxID=656914 RepID=A0A1W1V4B7_DESTI|nr:TIGR01440 family protein [Desulfonispora thiosulfatigenes]SMB88188.1 TIGR01440 family protein [Desulfonispora thiosulfatigenes DSM 11270]